MPGLTQTFHASANGVSLIEAADYAAMQVLLGIVDWTSTTENLSTTGTASLGALTLTGDVTSDWHLDSTTNTIFGVAAIGNGNLTHGAGAEGWYNTAIGASSLPAATTASYDVAIGYGASAAATTASRSTAVGVYALASSVAGGYNVGMGMMAGTYLADGSTPLTGPTNSVYLGAYSRGNAASETNAIAIGSYAFSNGSNTAVLGNAAITDTYLRQKVHITDAAGNNEILIDGTTGNIEYTGTLVKGDAFVVEDSLEASVPTYIYAVTGQECNVYFRNIFLGAPHASWEFDCNLPHGLQHADRWSFTPEDSDAGSADLYFFPKLGQYEWGYEVTSVVTTASTSGSGETRKVLVVSDSTGPYWIAELINLFSGDAMSITSVGSTSTTWNDSDGNSRTYDEEASSGWSWTLFLGETSPFWDGGEIDFAWYLTNNSITMDSNDWVIIHLGINDVFSLTTDAAVSTFLDSLETMVDTLVGTGASPAATTIRGSTSSPRVAICTTIPPNSSQDAFANGAASGQNKWRVERNIKLLQQWYLDTYDNATMVSRGIHILPLHCNLDTVNNFPTVSTVCNARNLSTYERPSDHVHPAQSGYYQMADSVYAFLKAKA